MLLVEQASQDSGEDLASGSVANAQLGQRFQLYRPSTIGKISLYLKRVGSPAGYLYCEVQSTTSDNPSGTALSSGTSTSVLCSSLATSYGWIDFDLPANDRPTVPAKVSRHIVLRSSGYTYSDGVTEVIWGVDATSPSFQPGEGETYEAKAAIWSNLSSGGDFAFKLYSRTRSVYSKLTSIEAFTRLYTDSGTYSTGTTPSIMEVMDFEEDVADEVDSWLAGAGFDTPLTNTEALNMIRPYTNAGVAFLIEMTAAQAGFSGERATDTRAGAFRMMYYELRNGLMDGGEFVDSLTALGLSRVAAGNLGRGLTSGGWLESEADDYTDSDTHIQKIFSRGQWDNP